MKIFIPGIIVIGCSLIIIVQGKLFKIMHWPMANISLILGYYGLIIGIIMTVICLIYYLVKKDNDSKKQF